MEMMNEEVKRAWLEKEKKESEKMMKTIDLGAWEIDARKLKLNKIIFQGAYGCVYQGIYHNKKVAVKVFHMPEENRSQCTKNFMQEVCISKDLDHPNIIKFIGIMKSMLEVNNNVKKSQDLDSTHDYCVLTEFHSHGSLNQYLQRHSAKKLPINIVTRLALDIAKGLSYLHSKNIMHRDVKTGNMLLDKNGRVKLIDFELSGIEDLVEHEPSVGTFGYMAPEVHSGNAYDHKCDVYSFGICLREIYCCSLAYDMIAIKDTIEEHPNFYKDMRPEIPSSCPSPLADLMKQCWDANPKKRPEMTSVVQMLMEFEESTLHKGGKGPSCFSCLG